MYVTAFFLLPTIFVTCNTSHVEFSRATHAHSSTVSFHANLGQSAESFNRQVLCPDDSNHGTCSLHLIISSSTDWSLRERMSRSSWWLFVSDIAIFVLKRDVKLQLTNSCWLCKASHISKHNVHNLLYTISSVVFSASERILGIVFLFKNIPEKSSLNFTKSK